MEGIVDMRKDVVDQKAEIEEELGKDDETQTIVLKLVQDIIKKLHTIDKNAVVDLKAEALDEFRDLQKAEEQIKKALKTLASMEEPTPEAIAENVDLVSKLEEKFGNEKDFSLSVGVKETSTGNPCDSVYLKNNSIDPSHVTMLLETPANGPYLRIKLEITNGPLSGHSLQKIQFSARGLKTGKQYQKLSGSDPFKISLHKTEEDLIISLTIFGCNIKNSPLKWSHNDEVANNIFGDK